MVTPPAHRLLAHPLLPTSQQLFFLADVDESSKLHLLPGARSERIRRMFVRMRKVLQVDGRHCSPDVGGGVTVLPRGSVYKSSDRRHCASLIASTLPRGTTVFPQTLIA